MAMKLGRMVSYLETFLTIKSQCPDHVVLQSHVTNENRYILLPECLLSWQDGSSPLWDAAHKVSLPIN